MPSALANCRQLKQTVIELNEKYFMHSERKESLTINGIKYSTDELKVLARENLKSPHEEHEGYFYEFILEWLAGSETIQFSTSGSTGMEKRVSFTRNQIMESAKRTSDFFNLTKNTNSLFCLSAKYTGGKMMVVRAFLNEMNLIVVPPSGNPLSTIEHRIDFAAMVPMQAYNCLMEPSTRETFRSISQIIIGGAEISHELESMLSQCPNSIYSTFGMTETLSHIALRKVSGNDRSEFYTVLQGIEISHDERGCLIIYLPGWSHPVITNDVVEIKSGKRFRWLGRYDNMINTGGVKIYPETVEKKLESFIKRSRFFIASLPDEKLGQKVVMILEGIDKTQLKEIEAGLRNILSTHEIPKEYYTVNKFLETAAGKIQRKASLENAKKI